MNSLKSNYIHFIESNITIATKPFYRIVSKEEISADVKEWQEAVLMTGDDLRDFGFDINDDELSDFFDITQDYKLKNKAEGAHRDTTDRTVRAFMFKCLVSNQ